MTIDGYTKPIFFPKLLLRGSVQELHNSLVIDPEDDGLKEAINAENNIIISDSTLRILFTPQLKKIPEDTSLCTVGNVAYLPKVYIHHYYSGVIDILKPKDQSQNS